MIKETTVWGVVLAAGVVMGCSETTAESTGTSSTSGTSSNSSTSSSGTAGGAGGTSGTGTAGGGGQSASECAAPVVLLRTGKDTKCSGGNTHAWPVGLKATDCHGWRSLDTNGKMHDNSANEIGCNADGSFSFVQFAGVIDCTGTGTLKEYTLNQCEQDIPPTLYTVAFDLTCCSDPSNAACKTEVPSVTVEGSTIFLNGAECAQ